MRLKHVARCCAAADPPPKRPTVQQCPGHLLTPLAPYQYKWISRERYLFPGLACACKLFYVVCTWRHPRGSMSVT